MVYDSESALVVIFGGFMSSDKSEETWTYNTRHNEWAKLETGSGPSSRYGHAMAYDAQSDRIVLFGGLVDGGRSSETWVLDLNQATWTQLKPSPHPSARWGAGMVYDARNDRMLLFGGVDDGPLGDTWSYDLDANRWVRLHPSNAPSSRYGHAMAYHSGLHQVVLFGGYLGNVVRASSNETWVYISELQRWQPLLTTSQPSPRTGEMAYDIESDRMILFGGITGPPTYRDGETWSLDLEAGVWNQISQLSSPTARSATMAYDLLEDLIVIFGGYLTSIASDETWVYDFNSNVWKFRRQAPGPLPMVASAAYDSQSDRTILFGGAAAPAGANETWAFDVDTGNWSNMRPGESSSPRAGHVMAYDARSDRIILFGGWTLDGNVNETWAYDYDSNTWTNLNPEPSPPLRASHNLAYDYESDRIILFGGRWPNSEAQTWAYDFEANSWTKMNPAIQPSRRQLHAMTYDFQSDRVLLFGGWIDTGPFPVFELSDETWTYDFESDSWSRLDPSSRPPALAGSGMTYDTDRDLAILFGGIARSHENGTWSYNPDSNEWTKLTPMVSPSPRWRPALTYDIRSGVVVLFGGATPGGLNGETWLYFHPRNQRSELSVLADATPSSGSPPLSVQFESFVSGGFAPYHYLWDFGDGDTSDLQNPAHSYATSGIYSATLRVGDLISQSMSVDLQIIVSIPVTETVITPPSPIWAPVGVATAFVASIVGLLVVWLSRYGSRRRGR